MLMPNIFGESLFDDFMDDFAFPDIDKKLVWETCSPYHEDR